MRPGHGAGLWLPAGLTLVTVAAGLVQADEHPSDRPVVLDSGISASDVESKPYGGYVRECADVLIERGTDVYGEKRRGLLVAILDVRTRMCPGSDVLPGGRSDPKPFVEPRLAWKAQGSDLFMDQVTVEVLYYLTELSGDPKYARFAEAYLKEAMGLVDEKGLFWWGTHRCYDVYNDEMRAAPVKGGKNWHEIHIIRPRWDRLWDVNRDAARRELEGIWQWHVIDKKTGEIDRHSSGVRGCDFAMSGGGFVYAMSFLFQKTKDPVWLERAALIADYYWRSRDPKTDLIPDCPNDRYSRFDGKHFDTSTTGVHCYFLLKAYELAGREELKDRALAYLRSYARRGYDEKTGKFWGALRLDGTPEPGPRQKSREFYSHADYDQNNPVGHVDLWQPHALGYEFAVATAQTYAYAFQLTGEREMLDTARRWAEWIRKSPPSDGPISSMRFQEYAKLFAPHGTYADLYGRAISFFVHMYGLTRQEEYLADARRFAKEAVSKLYYKGLLRGHPALPYYFAAGGVGNLMYALLQLDRVLAEPEAVLGAKAIRLGKGTCMLPWDNW